MFIDFELLGPNARVWLYQADRILSDGEVLRINAYMHDFCRGWKAHGRDLVSSSTVLHNVFLIIGVDESHNEASGCSIDASIAVIRELGRRHSIDFFNRLQVAFLNGNEVRLLKKAEIPGAIKTGILMPETPVFNTLINQAAYLKTGWLVPAGQTWLSRFFTPDEKTIHPDTTKG
jgi:hypothetical protein